MLKHIPKELTGELLEALSSLGHGEEILICDANFPYLSAQKQTIHTGCTSIADLLEKILFYFPLDRSVESAAAVMEKSRENHVFDCYQQILDRSEESTRLSVLERFSFYEHCRNIQKILCTLDTVPCGNIILKKGVVR